MKHVLWFFAAAVLAAAGPDWPAVEKEALDLLQQYIRIESINPPGDTSRAAALFKSVLETNGFAVKTFSSGPADHVNLVTRLAGRDRSKKPLLLLNHFDVVPVDRKQWKLDPFGATLEGGFIWGRGALDMKGIGILHLMTMVNLKRAGLTPPRDIVMLTTADEEMNGLGIQWMIRNQFAEIDAEYVLDEGGFGSREILTPGKLVFGVMVGEKQSVWVHLRAQGIAGHGSQPIPDNANVILLKAIEKALVLPSSQLHPAVAEMQRTIGAPMAKNKYTAAIQVNTASLTSLTSGVGSPPKINVIPSLAEATIDCRLLPGVDHREFLSEMRKRINDPRVTAELVSTPRDSGISDHRTPLFEAIRGAILKQHPGAIVTPMLVPHGTDSSMLRLKGMTAYGLTPMVLDLSTAGTMHSDSERIPVAEFHKGLRIFYDLATGAY